MLFISTQTFPKKVIYTVKDFETSEIISLIKNENKQ